MSIGKSIVTIGATAFSFANYPFAPSSAYPGKSFLASEISDIELDGFPPSICIGQELLFVSAQQKDSLSSFVSEHKIPLSTRPDVWSLLLEPFLDVQFTEEANIRIMNLLQRHGLTESEVKGIRSEVGAAMTRYNMDSMLWDWTYLGLLDVLYAMQSHYDAAQFHDFYWRAMKVALR